MGSEMCIRDSITRCRNDRSEAVIRGADSIRSAEEASQVNPEGDSLPVRVSRPVSSGPGEAGGGRERWFQGRAGRSGSVREARPRGWGSEAARTRGHCRRVSSRADPEGLARPTRRPFATESRPGLPEKTGQGLETSWDRAVRISWGGFGSHPAAWLMAMSASTLPEPTGDPDTPGQAWSVGYAADTA